MQNLMAKKSKAAFRVISNDRDSLTNWKEIIPSLVVLFIISDLLDILGVVHLNC